MISGLDLDGTVSYSLKEDTTEPRTVFKLGIIPSILYGKIQAQATTSQFETAYNILQIGLKGWENLEGIAFETRKEKVFGREVDAVPLSLLERLPLKVVSELCQKLMEINQLTDDETKN